MLMTPHSRTVAPRLPTARLGTHPLLTVRGTHWTPAPAGVLCRARPWPPRREANSRSAFSLLASAAAELPMGESEYVAGRAETRGVSREHYSPRRDNIP